MTSPLAFLILAAVMFAASSALIAWRQRRALLTKLQADWGRPSRRPRDIRAIGDYYRSRLGAAGSREFLDERTWNDLNMDAVFEVLDRTESTLGQQVLYHRLRSAPVGAHLDAFEDLVGRLSSDVEARQRAQRALAHLQNPAGYDLWWIAQPDSLERRPWHVIFPIIAALMASALIAMYFWPGAFLILVIGSVVNLAIRHLTAARVASVIAPFRQISALIGVAEALRFLSTAGTEPIVIVLHQELPRLRRLKAVVRRTGPDPLKVGELAFALMEYLNVIFLLDVNAVYFGAPELRRCGPSLLRIIEAVGHVDAAISIASYRARTPGWTRPRFVAPGQPARFEDVRHPLIADAVPNSLQMGPPQGVIVTGSNMSGKTTFIRTVAVNALMAQTIICCLASAYEAPILRLRSCIGRSDDLLAGKSYYLVEVEAVLGIVRASASREPHLFLFDELFRGTNAVERIAAAEAVLAYLVAAGGSSTPHFGRHASSRHPPRGVVRSVCSLNGRVEAALRQWN